jgi:hypothetical protein
MEDQSPASQIPLTVLIVGLVIVVGFTIWSGSQFFLYGGSILYGVAGGVGVGAAWAFCKQIKIRISSK